MPKKLQFVTQVAHYAFATVPDKSNVRVAQDSRETLCTHHAVLTARPREIVMKTRKILRVLRARFYAHCACIILRALRVHNFTRIVRKIS